MVFRPSFAVLIALSAVLAGCARDGEIDSTGGISITRSACPAVAVPAYTGDMTIFDPPTSRDARAIDIVATLTNLRSTCTDAGENVIASATFDILATRRDGGAAREVIVPYFASVIQGGRIVVSKSISRVAIRFAQGQTRATAQGSASGSINRAAATLPEDIRDKITRKRKASDQDATIDPLADPAVREAVARASFELLIGLQLTEGQLSYNATR